MSQRIFLLLAPLALLLPLTHLRLLHKYYHNLSRPPQTLLLPDPFSQENGRRKTKECSFPQDRQFANSWPDHLITLSRFHKYFRLNLQNIPQSSQNQKMTQKPKTKGSRYGPELLKHARRNRGQSQLNHGKKCLQSAGRQNADSHRVLKTHY